MKRFAMRFPIGMALLALCCSARKDDGPGGEAPKVVARTLAPEDWQEALSLPAMAWPAATVNVVARVPGRVAAWHCEEGSLVTEGQALLELDTRDLRTALRNAEAQAGMARAGLKAAEVQRDNVAKERQRLLELAKTGSISPSDADRIEAGFQAAEAQVGVARAQLEMALAGLEFARRNLAEATVRAPVSGLVAKRMVDVGQETAPSSGIPLLVIQVIDPLKVEASAPEAWFSRLAPGQEATVAFDGIPGREFGGRLEMVGPVVDPASKMVRLRVAVPNVPGQDGRPLMVPGMSGSLHMRLAAGRVFVIPLNTVRREDGEDVFVLLVGKEDRIEERRIRPWRRDGLRLLVQAGLAEGERLVTVAPKDLAPGTVVRVTEP
ncbi:efflux RND transporter periplasmic adaptor subunit [Myxococcota bacterium]|nr:efflux RND transporter periplasmic adaptor subunit [Myxococcota bacterium]